MNLLIFGPNGSGKGTQGALLMEKYGVAHIESGAVFRQHVGQGTELGKKAKEYMDRGELVPDSITIPMVLETLKTKGADGWLLDGFPRNIAQAEQLHKAMQEQGMKLDYVVEIDLPRNIARDRIMGRRVCKNDGNHPNNIRQALPSSPMAMPAGSVAASSRPVLTIRTKPRSTSAMTFIMMTKRGRWLQPTTSRRWPKRAKPSTSSSMVRAQSTASKKRLSRNWD